MSELSGLKKMLETGSKEDLFASIFRRFRNPITNYLRSRGASPDNTEDIYQETMLRMWDELDRPQGWEDERHIKAAVYLISRRILIDRVRRTRTREALHIPTPDGTELADRTFDEACLKSPRARELAESHRWKQLTEDIKLDELIRTTLTEPPDYDLFILRDCEGFSIDELALMFPMTETQISTRLSRARQKLRTRLAKAGIIVFPHRKKDEENRNG